MTDPETTETETTNTHAGDRDCFVFLPGMGSNASVDQSVLGLSGQLARVLSLNAKDKTATFYAKVEAAKEAGDIGEEIGTVYRTDAEGTRAILDLYRCDYREDLVERFAKRNLFVRTVYLLAALPVSIIRVFRAFFTGQSSKTRSETIQLFYALGILSLLVLYVGILFVALWTTGGQLLHVISPSATAWIASIQPKFAAEYPSYFATAAQAVVVISAAIAFFLPSGVTLKDLIGKAAVNYLCLINYLNLGDGRSTVYGKLERLIDNIELKSGIAKRDGKSAYRSINILAYSFGSIVALDCLFPIDQQPSAPLQSVSTLITIGCPFDFIRSLWRDYFDNRRRFSLGTPTRWLNVYSLEDVLGSNFRNDSTSGDANINVQGTSQQQDPDIPIPSVNVHYTQGLNYSKLSWFSSLTLLGLRSHSMYWGAGPGPDSNCFNTLVPRIFEGDPALD